MSETVVSLLSGGLDSTTLLHDLVDQKYTVCPLTIVYGQKHRKEVRAAQFFSRKLGLTHQVLDLSVLKPLLRSALTAKDWSIPHVPETAEHYNTLKQTIVPNRNAILLSIAVGYAYSVGATKVFYGAHASDKDVYPDCRPEFVVAFEAMEKLALDIPDFRVVAPYVNHNKAKIVSIGTKLGVEYGKTWSCLARGTEVLTLAGPEPIETLSPGRWVWGWNGATWVPSHVHGVLNQGVKRVFNVTLDDRTGRQSHAIATADHLFMRRDGSYARVDSLQVGDSLMPSSLHRVCVGRAKKEYMQMFPHNEWKEQTQYAHRIVADYFGIVGEIIHHIDGNGFNNDPSNLAGMKRGEHTTMELTGSHQSLESNVARAKTVRRQWKSMSVEEREERRSAISNGVAMAISNGKRNHRVVSIREAGTSQTWDIQTTTQNFALGAGIFVHNCYEGKKLHCGKCSSCRERRRAFSEAEIDDPTTYSIAGLIETGGS